MNRNSLSVQTGGRMNGSFGIHFGGDFTKKWTVHFEFISAAKIIEINRNLNSLSVQTGGRMNGSFGIHFGGVFTKKWMVHFEFICGGSHLWGCVQMYVKFKTRRNFTFIKPTIYRGVPSMFLTCLKTSNKQEKNHPCQKGFTYSIFPRICKYPVNCL